MRSISLVVAFVFFLAPLDGWAHEHKAMFAVGVRDSMQSDLWGLALGFDHGFHKTCELGDLEKECVAPLSLLVGFSYVQGSHEGKNLNQYTLEVGPRLSHGSGRLQPFAHSLVGILLEDTEEAKRTSASLTGSFGVGVDILMKGRWLIRPQFEWSWIHDDKESTTQWFPQVSLSVVFRLPDLEE